MLVGSHQGVDCRFYFDPAEGQMLAMELFPDENADPCEIYFTDYRLIDGRMLPGRMSVRFGDDPYAAFEIQGFKCHAKAAKKEKDHEQSREKTRDRAGPGRETGGPGGPKNATGMTQPRGGERAT